MKKAARQCRTAFFGHLLYDLGVGSIATNAVDTVEAGSLGLVALAGGDDLAVAGLQAEAELAGLIHINFKLGVGNGLEILDSLVFQLGGNSVLADALDTVQAALLAGVNFAGSDDFAVAGLQVKLDASIGLTDHKLSHDMKPPKYL